MPIEVELPDGTIAEFPDGTDTATMERALAAYRRRPDFSNVQTTVRSRAKPKTVAQLTGVSDRALAPTTGMSPAARAFTAFDKSMSDAGRGVKQVATRAGMLGLGLQAGLMNRLGLDGNEVVRRYGLPMQDYSRALEAEEAERRQTDAPLMATPAGMAGNVIGQATQWLTPGAALRGTSIGRMLLPTTVRGNAALGAGAGFIQPATSDADRALNTGLGAGAGGISAAIPAVAGAGVRRLRSGVTGDQRKAGRAMLEALQGRAFTPEESRVPGVRLPLGESTLDPGLIRLEDSLRTNPETGSMFSALDLSNNQARVAQLRAIAGEPADMAQAVQARSAAADPFYAAASGQSVQIDPQMQAILSRLPRSVMNKAREFAVMGQSAVPKDAQSLTGQQLHYVKLALDDALSKAGQGSIGNVERRLLMQAKDELTERISAAIPEYGQAMGQFTAMSAPINRMQFGQELLQRGTAAQADALGNPLLQPGMFGRAMKNIDDVAQSATGFDRATAKGLLEPDQFSMLGAVNDDLRRQSVRMTTPGGGSRTAARLLSEQGLMGRLGVNTLSNFLSRSVPVLGGAVDWWQERATRDALTELGRLFTSDPVEAARIMSALSGPQRSNVEKALIAIGGQSAIATTN
jgi:hypothetical protein